MGWHGKAARVTIVPEEGTPEEIIHVDSEREVKTPSQRLRAVLFILWQTEGKKGQFESWYQHKMETLIEHVKKKLPDQ